PVGGVGVVVVEVLLPEPVHLPQLVVVAAQRVDQRVEGLADPARRDGLVVAVETSGGGVGRLVVGVEQHRSAKQRKLIDDGRIVSDQHVGDVEQVVALGEGRVVQQPVGVLGRNRYRFADEV